MQPSTIAASDETDGSSELSQTQLFLGNTQGQIVRSRDSGSSAGQKQFHTRVLLHLRRFEKRDGGAAQVGEQMEPRNLQITVSHPGENPTHQHQKNE